MFFAGSGTTGRRSVGGGGAGCSAPALGREPRARNGGGRGVAGASRGLERGRGARIVGEHRRERDVLAGEVRALRGLGPFA